MRLGLFEIVIVVRWRVVCGWWVVQAEGAPWLTRVNPREIQRAEILANRQALTSLIERLQSARPVVAKGSRSRSG